MTRIFRGGDDDADRPWRRRRRGSSAEAPRPRRGSSAETSRRYRWHWAPFADFADDPIEPNPFVLRDAPRQFAGPDRARGPRGIEGESAGDAAGMRRGYSVETELAAAPRPSTRDVSPSPVSPRPQVRLLASILAAPESEGGCELPLQTAACEDRCVIDYFPLVAPDRVRRLRKAMLDERFYVPWMRAADLDEIKGVWGEHVALYPAGVRSLSISTRRSPFGLILAALECGHRPRSNAGEASTNARNLAGTLRSTTFSRDI